MSIAKYTEADMQILAAMFAEQYNAWKKGTEPRKFIRNINRADYSEDFITWYNATDDLTNTSGSGRLYDSQDLYELEFLASRRLGVGNMITEQYARDALFNWFEPKKADSKNTVVKIPGFKKWLIDTDFKNQAIIWDTHKRIYGIGLLVKFWKAHDDMSKPAPKAPPKAFQVIPPTLLAATNTYDTRYLTYDEDIWEFQGGHLRVAKIHSSRIEVIRGAPKPDEYRGYSALEPCYLSLICYYNALIAVTKGIAKWGNMIPVLKSASTTPTPAEYQNFLKLMQEFVMNNFIILGKNDEIITQSTNIGQGLFQTLEIFKEDIASTTRIPLNVLFGRSESGGIGGEGALTAERTYLNGLSNEQVQISDDFIRIFQAAGFDFEGVDLMWNLALQKTRQQQLIEERMELENEMLKHQVNSIKLENTMLKTQKEMFDKYKDTFTPEEQIQAAKNIEEDFQYQRSRWQNFEKLRQMISLRGNSNV